MATVNQLIKKSRKPKVKKTKAKVKNNKIKKSDLIIFSRNASNKPASKLGLSQGETISFNNAIKALAIKSANDVATAVFQGADAVMLSAETAIGKFPTQTVTTMNKTILSSEKYKKQHIEDFKNSIKGKTDPIKSILLSVKNIAYNPDMKAIIVFSNSGKSAKLVSALRPSVKILTISPNVNVSRQVSLLWGVESINSRDANGWRDMMNITKEIIKKAKLTFKV